MKTPRRVAIELPSQVRLAVDRLVQSGLFDTTPEQVIEELFRGALRGVREWWL